MNFQIEGQFITNLARTWFWDEKRPVGDCMDLIRNCCGDMDVDTKDTIAREILEGRKKLVGTNEFMLEDDNEYIRPITDRLMEEQKMRIIKEIETDMLGDFLRYVDKWATIKSTHPDALRCSLGEGPFTFAACRHYFAQKKSNAIPDTWEDYMAGGVPLFESPDMGGLWLINEPETVYEACHGEMNRIGSEEFWQRIYELKKEDEQFRERNERYLGSLKQRDIKAVREREKELERRFEERHPELYEVDEEPEYETPEWVTYQYEKTGNIDYRMEPDGMERAEGLISPSGDFYSCTFGGHNPKAYYLLICHAKEFGQTPEYFKQNVLIRLDNALDTLLLYGWCALRSVYGYHVEFPAFPKHLTKHQVNTIFDACGKHGIEPNNMEEVMDA